MGETLVQGPRAFPTTHWSLVARAGCDNDQAQRQALIELLNRYMPALRSHLVYHKRIDTHRADDLLQGFLLSKVIEQDLIAAARKERGRFRSFLLTALDRFVISQFRQDQAQKRGGGAAASLDQDAPVPDPSAAPGNSFEVAWARQLLAETIERMQQECKASARPDVWGVFEARMLNPLLHQQEPLAYEQLVEQFAFTSPSQAFNVLTTGKRMFVRILRDLIAEYEPDEQSIDAEIVDLQRLLALTGGTETP